MRFGGWTVTTVGDLEYLLRNFRLHERENSYRERLPHYIQLVIARNWFVHKNAASKFSSDPELMPGIQRWSKTNGIVYEVESHLMLQVRVDRLQKNYVIQYNTVCFITYGVTSIRIFLSWIDVFTMLSYGKTWLNFRRFFMVRECVSSALLSFYVSFNKWIKCSLECAELPKNFLKMQ